MMPIMSDRVDEIFCQVEELAPDAREAFLDEACADDSELRREVLSLLVAYTETGDDFLERPLIEAPATWTSPEGRHLGPFRLVREIGRGGMSRVFLAARDDQDLYQEVAVKILKWGIDTAEVVRRFHQERRILARLEHPFIARFLDSGNTEDDLPYVVMELVEGEPIDRYCEIHSLSVAQRLELFRKVCSAVEFAHRSLIVHRDLKPSNVLVTADGTPKLLDFGIAKLLEDGVGSNVLLTQANLTATGTHPMTMAYASPEQIRGEVITTASDVYSLGVILYQLLTGVRPYGESNPSTPELLRAICEEEATKPSTAAVRVGHDRARQRRLSGDLDSIVLKSLEKDPGRRYGSVEQLADDVQRHLDGQTVMARDATLFYRAGRYLRRHRLEVVSLVVIFLLVLGFSTHTVILRNRAIESREQVQAVTKVMGSVFEAWNPEDRLQLNRELLDGQVKAILDNETLEPELRATLIEALGSAYIGLGHYAEAGLLFEECLALRRQMPNVLPQELVGSLLDLADVRRRFERYQEAVTLVEEALSILRRSQAATADIAKTLANLAKLAKAQGDLLGAEKLYSEALRMKIRVLGEEHEDVATGKHNLAATLRALGRIEEAEGLHRESLALRTELFGERSLEVASSLNSLALCLRDLNKLAEAEDHARRVLEIRREIYGDRHSAVSTALNNLATVLQRRGALEESAALLQQALVIRRQVLGEKHSSVARVLRNQATLLLAMGQPSQAEATVSQALQIFLQGSARKESRWRVADAESVLGECLLALGRRDEAATLLEGSYRILDEVLGEGAPQTREALQRLKVLRQNSLG